MSALIDNGGPAFPTTEAHGLNSGVPGMTLRDYFIAHLSDENQNGDYGDWAKEAVVGRPCPNGKEDGWADVLAFEAEFRAKWRVMRADAMLAARQGSAA